MSKFGQLLRNNQMTKLDSKQALLVAQAPKAAASEQVRMLQNSIAHQSKSQELKLLAVTSGSRAEGRSLISANLAGAYAQQGKKVLYLEADLRQPVGHDFFQTDFAASLNDVLKGQADWQSAVVPTAISENLFALFAKAEAGNPLDLLGSERFEELCAQVAEAYDLVIFDTPAFLEVADAARVGQLVDGLVLVVRRLQTTGDKAKETQKLMKQLDLPVLGVVLNGA